MSLEIGRRLVYFVLPLLVCQGLIAQGPSTPFRRENSPTALRSDAPKEVSDWFRTAAIPLKTPNPDTDLDDMLPLQSVVGNARIVAMGEATHGSREFFLMKHRMLEFLAEKMGFTVFAIEANWPESLVVNDYVLNGKGDPAVALAGMYFWTWNTEEVLDVIRWMRKYNENPAHTKKLKFYGFDMQIARVAVSNVEEDLQRVVVSEWLHAFHRMRLIGAVYNEPFPASYFTPVAPDSFDVIFFVNQTTPARENPQLPRQMDADFGRG